MKIINNIYDIDLKTVGYDKQYICFEKNKRGTENVSSIFLLYKMDPVYRFNVFDSIYTDNKKGNVMGTLDKKIINLLVINNKKFLLKTMSFNSKDDYTMNKTLNDKKIIEECYGTTLDNYISSKKYKYILKIENIYFTIKLKVDYVNLFSRSIETYVTINNKTYRISFNDIDELCNILENNNFENVSTKIKCFTYNAKRYVENKSLYDTVMKEFSDCDNKYLEEFKKNFIPKYVDEDIAIYNIKEKNITYECFTNLTSEQIRLKIAKSESIYDYENNKSVINPYTGEVIDDTCKIDYRDEEGMIITNFLFCYPIRFYDDMYIVDYGFKELEERYNMYNLLK